MATKSGQPEPEKAEVVEELLDELDVSLDRVKVLYEQYFLGIQKQPPTYLHTELERKIREIAQLQVRNTALRYRFATLQQKFGSYNSYWRRTLRQIENGTYTRSLSKIGRQAARTGAEVPEEILAAMPRRMRDQVMRDREAAVALARLREQQRAEAAGGARPGPGLRAGSHPDVELDSAELDHAAFIVEPDELRRSALGAGGPLDLDEDDAELDLDAYFAAITTEGEPDPLPGAAGHPPAGVAFISSGVPEADPAPPRDSGPAALAFRSGATTGSSSAIAAGAPGVWPNATTGSSAAVAAPAVRPGTTTGSSAAIAAPAVRPGATTGSSAAIAAPAVRAPDTRTPSTGAPIVAGAPGVRPGAATGSSDVVAAPAVRVPDTRTPGAGVPIVAASPAVPPKRAPDRRTPGAGVPIVAASPAVPPKHAPDRRTPGAGLPIVAGAPAVPPKHAPDTRTPGAGVPIVAASPAVP
ncbi:MAG TPA: hypothetical protein VFT22_38900, partial [Kofleriaceae bacterium]|nr:hypothetical protein [Kofleriaceae bacterium]